MYTKGVPGYVIHYEAWWETSHPIVGVDFRRELEVKKLRLAGKKYRFGDVASLVMKIGEIYKPAITFQLYWAKRWDEFIRKEVDQKWAEKLFTKMVVELSDLPPRDWPPGNRELEPIFKKYAKILAEKIGFKEYIETIEKPELIAETE
jgi:hypothetical protein